MQNLKNDFKKYLAQTTDFLPVQIEVENAGGIYLYDREGKRYTDLLSGVAVNNLGYQHPAIVKAIKMQAERYQHLMVYGEYPQKETVALAKKLVKLLPEQFEQMFFVNSGSEAIEGAIKTARLFTGKTEVVSFAGSYHGSTLASLNLLGDETFKRPFRPLLPGFIQLEFNNRDQLQLITGNTSCVILETLQTASGMLEAETGFLSALRQRCSETATLIILDEIQTAVGRTGNHFSMATYQFAPDIVCLAKSLGGGLPIGAFAASRKIMDALKNGHPLLGHATTFGGHPLVCATALAFLETLEKEQLILTMMEKETQFREKLVHPLIKEIRGKGLLLAIDLGDENLTKQFVSQALESGLITYWFLFNKLSFSIMPPMIITLKQIDEVCASILWILDDLA